MHRRTLTLAACLVALVSAAGPARAWPDQPVSLLVHPRSSVLLHRRFEAASPGLLGLVPERWWVAPERRRY